ncbi:MAG: OmpH family outer membrane protein [Chthoniobacteraceae bacterium]|nr:OmpH family outer membrane protein [Chthoniobacteraceae bacterium]
MKTNLIAFSLVAAIALATSSIARADVKIGYVDMNKIFSSYYKTDQAKKRIEEAQSTAQNELQERADVFNKNRDAILKLNEELNKPELSKETKEKKTKERDEKAEEAKRQEKEILELRSQRLKNLQEQANRMRAGIVEEIRKLVNDKVKADQYDLVLDKSGLSSNGIEVVLYSKDSTDFSDDIIKALNADKPKDSASAPAPSKTK